MKQGIVKEVKTKDYHVWIEQHNDMFILKHQETGKEVTALNAISNLSILLDMFDKFVPKNQRGH